jgi:large subunit ribosomal protein L4
MTSLDVVGAGGKKAGSVELDPAVFEAPIKPHLFHAEVRRQLSQRRGGRHSTKNRAAVSGGGAKPYRQKGTGRARQGTTRAPQFHGGGVVFGPVPRSYEHKLPKKMRRAALRAALSLRLREEAVSVVESFELEEYSTRRMVEILTALGLMEDSLLIVLQARDIHVERSARNLPQVSVIRSEGLNVYDVLRHRRILFVREAALSVQRRLGAAGEEVTS